MTDLAEFLLARIGEDEAAARDATPGPWRWDREPGGEWGHQPPDLVTVAEEEHSYTLNDGAVRTYVAPVGTVVSSWGHDADGVSVSDEDAAHIARHDPARVLAECDVKRRTVLICDLNSEEDVAALSVLRLLALPDADHPDYDEAWRP